ncbi:MAG: LysE family transporter [Pseudomonadota bacterium]|nr:LysE family transporter [Pseudomonadota bacterium]
MMEHFISYFWIGLGVAISFGPISALCVQKTLKHGISAAIWVGVGSSVAYACYGSIVFLGLTSFSSLLLKHQALLKFFGSGMLFRLAYKEFRGLSKDYSAQLTHHMAQDSLSPLIAVDIALLTLSNPITIVSFIGLMSGFNLENFSYQLPYLAILGIASGSFFWRVTLGFLTKTLDQIIPAPRWVGVLQRLTILILLYYGMSTLFTAIMISSR